MRRGRQKQSGSVAVSILVLIGVALATAAGLRYASSQASETYSAQGEAVRSIGGAASSPDTGDLPPPRGGDRSAATEPGEPGVFSVGRTFGVAAGQSFYDGVKGVSDLVNPLSPGFVGARINQAASALGNLALNPSEQLAIEGASIQRMWQGLQSAATGARETLFEGSATQQAALAGALVGAVVDPFHGAGKATRLARLGDLGDGPLPVHDLRPSQTDLGTAVADGRADLWRREAQDLGMTTEDYARNVLKPKMDNKELPAYIDPDGNVRNTDGHHRVWALRQIAEETGVPLGVKPQIQRDYRGWDHDDYARDAVENLGIRGKPGQSPREIVDSLPSTYHGLRDNSMRSLVGKSFIHGKLKGSMFVDFIQFEVAEKLMKSGLRDRLVKNGLLDPDADGIPASAARDPRVQDVVNDMIFGDPKMKKFLKKRLRDPKKKNKLNKAFEEYARN